jgi:hypothetical protein
VSQPAVTVRRSLDGTDRGRAADPRRPGSRCRPARQGPIDPAAVIHGLLDRSWLADAAPRGRYRTIVDPESSELVAVEVVAGERAAERTAAAADCMQTGS